MRDGRRRACRLIVLEDEPAVSARVAGKVAAFAGRHPNGAIGLAAGATMAPIYREIVAAHRRGEISFARRPIFGLDEFAGLGADHPALFARFLDDRLLRHVDMDRSLLRLPAGGAADPEAEAAAYEKAIAAAGGIGLQLLGIGTNGHIGFNEPGSDLRSRTRLVALSPSTRRANEAAFPPGETALAFGLTMGIGTILDAREILLAAIGEAKADALARALDGPIDMDCPASALRLHPSVTIVCDRKAAGKLERSRPDPVD